MFLSDKVTNLNELKSFCSKWRDNNNILTKYKLATQTYNNFINSIDSLLSTIGYIYTKETYKFAIRTSFISTLIVEHHYSIVRKYIGFPNALDYINISAYSYVVTRVLNMSEETGGFKIDKNLVENVHYHNVKISNTFPIIIQKDKIKPFTKNERIEINKFLQTFNDTITLSTVRRGTFKGNLHKYLATPFIKTFI